jgi:hypothetical protein
VSPASAQVAGVRAALVEAQRQADALASSLSDAEWATRPPGGGWAAAECIAHLTLTTNAYIPMLDEAAAAVPRGSRPPAAFRRGLRAAFLEWILEPPSRARSKTLPAFVPTANAPRADAIAAFGESQRTLLAWIDDNATAALDRMIIPSPFNRSFRYNAYAALRILAAHQRRHLWQAARAARGIP